MLNYLIVGGSRGLGAALSARLPQKGDTLRIVSRSEPSTIGLDDGVERTWIKSDLSKPLEASAVISDRIASAKIDLLVYCAGIWESSTFENTPPSELSNILQVNLTSPILLVQKLLNANQLATQGKLVFIGSTSGLDNSGSKSVAYASSKAGIRGASFALRETLREREISTICLSPGSIASELDHGSTVEEAVLRYEGERIPMDDFVTIIEAIMKLSPVSCVKEIVIPALKDTDV